MAVLAVLWRFGWHLVGWQLAIKTKPKALKLIFALTTLAAAVFMYIKASCN